jgi:4-hydroxy-3-methylbut-2-en-1-yl diphosphate synthase IspG/GcpE
MSKNEIEEKKSCICCHTQLLHHLNRDISYWFCPNCSLEMFDISTVIESKKEKQNQHPSDKHITANLG